MGDEPSHPELLDWLATELVARGWSLKAMHRLIVTSATYRQSSRPAAGHATPTRRTTGSRARIAAGSTARRSATPCSRLRPAEPGTGRPRRLPSAARRADQALEQGCDLARLAAGRGPNRRSLYVFVRRNLRYPFFEAFDRPDTNASCPRRPVTTIAPQALSLLNSRLSSDSGSSACREGETGGRRGNRCDGRANVSDRPGPTTRRGGKEVGSRVPL